MNLSLLYPRYVELKKVDEVFARRCILRAYENLKNISKVARLFGTTRKTVKTISKTYQKDRKTLQEEPQNI
ncbi:MAG: hypothetical protein QXQ64_05540 [Candidatus Bathyarchaeia archaeon]